MYLEFPWFNNTTIAIKTTSVYLENETYTIEINVSKIKSYVKKFCLY